MYLDKRIIRDIVSDEAEDYWEILQHLKRESLFGDLKEKIYKVFRRIK